MSDKPVPTLDELKLKPIKRTKTSRSTDAATLEALAAHDAVVVEISPVAAHSVSEVLRGGRRDTANPRCRADFGERPVSVVAEHQVRLMKRKRVSRVVQLLDEDDAARRFIIRQALAAGVPRALPRSHAGRGGYRARR